MHNHRLAYAEQRLAELTNIRHTAMALRSSLSAEFEHARYRTPPDVDARRVLGSSGPTYERENELLDEFIDSITERRKVVMDFIEENR